MKKILLGFFCFILPFIAMAKGIGYGKTVWGMSPNEVITAENGNAVLIKPEQFKGSWGKARINNINIGSGEYTVTFLFNGEDELIQTNLVSNDKNSPSIATMRFNSLHELLTQKYGEPIYKGVDKVTWKTADTTIELSKTIIPRVLTQTSVRYVPNARLDADTSKL